MSQKLEKQETPPKPDPPKFTEEQIQELIKYEIRSELNIIHAEEFMKLSFEDDTYRARSWKYIRLIVHVVWSYLLFFFRTWSWTIWNIITLPMASLDIVSQLFWAIVSCALLFTLGISCLVLREPHLSKRYYDWANKKGEGLSLINSPKPEIFTEVSPAELAAAKDALDDPSVDNYTSRKFNVDIAKLLLICASLMYERPRNRQEIIMNRLQTLLDSQKPKANKDGKDGKDQKDREVVPTGEPDSEIPGETTKQILGEENARAFQAAVDSVEHQGTIEKIATKLGLEFHVVSELNSQGTSCCGLFYSPAHKFIILAFKGTSASEFDEWLTDCSFTAVDGSAWIRGFGNVQKGFMDRMFPAKLTRGARLPYDTIRIATKHVADTIQKYRGGTAKVDIWFTGHSLGCAMSALAYARANMEPKEFGKNARIRDGYIFAAPVMCDSRSVNAFNNQLFHKPDHPRTLWRITQGRDAVATALPAWGNAPRRRLSPFNLFGFAHLGTEITMKDAPEQCVLSGHHILPGAKVKIVSNLSLFQDKEDKAASTKDKSDKSTTPGDEVKSESSEKPKNTLLKVMNFMSYVPVVNRMVDHCTFMYWDQLSRIQHGDAVWDFDNAFFPSLKTLLGY